MSRLRALCAHARRLPPFRRVSVRQAGPVLTILLAPGCGAGTEATPEPSERTPPSEASVEGGIARLYERQFAYLQTDSEEEPLVVTWSFRTETFAESPRREVLGIVGRGSSWDPFLRDAWITPPDPAPERLHPRRPMRIVVGMGDEIDGILYQSEGRLLELAFGSVRASWRESRGGTLRLLDGEAILQDHGSDGLLLDLQRARSEESGAAPWTEWMLLHGGGRTIAMIGVEPGVWEAWVLGPGGDRPLPPVTSAWSERRVLDDARREVPSAWTLGSESGAVEGDIRVASAWIEEGGGVGPVFPVEGLQRLEGTLTLEGQELEVVGIHRLSRR